MESTGFSDAARLYVWEVTETAGFESAWVALEGLRLQAKGQAVGQLAVPYWLSYELRTDSDAATVLLDVSVTTAESSRHLELRRDDNGWTSNGREVPELAEARDCDLECSPVTNTMPIIRHELHRRRVKHSFVMAFVQIPTLAVHAVKQEYTHLGVAGDNARVRYSSGDFAADLLIDPDGFVIDYPTMAHRIEKPS
jgi:uncharacterized protein